MESALPLKRNSHIDYGVIYFWTATINGWQRLLERDIYKQVIVDSLQHLSDKGKIDVYGFIIMPNHMHLIWRVNEPNGRESPHGSLLKYTAHIFRRMLLEEGISHLVHYKVCAANKEHEFWQRDPLAIPLFSHKVAMQKLNYLHYNPLAEHWCLVKDPCDYWYSSARYYLRNDKTFPFLKNLWGEL
jgi:putative transposase